MKVKVNFKLRSVTCKHCICKRNNNEVVVFTADFYYCSCPYIFIRISISHPSRREKHCKVKKEWSRCAKWKWFNVYFNRSLPSHRIRRKSTDRCESFRRSVIITEYVMKWQRNNFQLVHLDISLKQNNHRVTRFFYNYYKHHKFIQNTLGSELIGNESMIMYFKELFEVFGFSVVSHTLLRTPVCLCTYKRKKCCLLSGLNAEWVFK